MKGLIFTILALVFLFPLHSQVKEEVKVDWWVLPVFAIDKAGDSVDDLETGDVELRINGIAVPDFMLYKRPFLVNQAREEKIKLPPEIKKRRSVFLLFDPVFTSKENSEKTKYIAREMVENSDDDTLFSVMMLDTFAGLVHAGGPTADKEEVKRLIDEKVVWEPDARGLTAALTGMGGARISGTLKGKFGGTVSKYEGREHAFFYEEFSTHVKKANVDFLRSFQTFYYALNSIPDNKFVYLFSEGIPLLFRKMVKFREEEYYEMIKYAADYLGQCGSVLFIVNPAGAVTSERSALSGEDTMRFLARESGGEYVEGDKVTISTRIEKMHRAYYEIAFSEQSDWQGDLRRVNLVSRRKGVDLFTPRSLEKPKDYGKMKDIEKEVLALNLLNDNPLFRSPLKNAPLKVAKKQEDEKSVTYRVTLPREYKGRVLELYKIWLFEDKQDAAIEKETLDPGGRHRDITVAKKDGVEGQLVLVHEETAVALVQGLFDEDAVKKEVTAADASRFDEKTAGMSAAQIEELRGVLDGAASYCRKLEGAVLHYVCTEKVVEMLDVLRTHKSERQDQYDARTGVMLQGLRANKGMGNDVRIVRRKITNKYENDYQLIREKGNIEEQRKLLRGDEKKIFARERPVGLDTFISRKISLTPLALLSAQSQEKFTYRLVGKDKIKGIKTVLIECFPRNPGDTASGYGKLWLDREDYSLVRMSLNPISIGGYPRLLKLAGRFKANLVLTCRIDFGREHNGLRFPTQVDIREKYSGGSIRKVVGVSTWERSKTTYRYDDYKFFQVSVSQEADWKN